MVGPCDGRPATSVHRCWHFFGGHISNGVQTDRQQDNNSEMDKQCVVARVFDATESQKPNAVGSGQEAEKTAVRESGP